MIRDNFRLVGLSLEIHSPMSKTFDDYEEFLIVDLIVALGRSELPRQVSYRAEFSLFIGLAQASSDCFV
jgi:hypothetical protein